LRFDGSADLRGLDVEEAGGGKLASCERLHADGIRLTGTPDRLRVRGLTLDGAFAKIHIDKEARLNLSELATTPAPATPAPPASPASEGMPIEVGTIDIRGASVDFKDDSLILPFATLVHSLGGSIRDLSTHGSAASSVALEGRVDETGYAKVDGALRPGDPLAATDMRVTFRGVPLVSLSPYAAEFAGYALESGSLDLDIRYQITNRALIGDHRVVAKDLVLGKKVEGATGAGFPVRLAIALLKDKEGRIDLSVPVEGTVDSPEFAYRKILWQAVKKILANVATAPFRALGRLFGSDEDDLELVDFDPGSSELIPPELDKLQKLAEELGRRPELALKVEGRFDGEADTEALRRLQLEARIASRREAAAQAAAETDAATLELVLESLYAERFSPAALETKRLEFTVGATPPAPAPVETQRRKRGKQKGSPPPVAPPSPAAGLDAAGFYDALQQALVESEEVGEEELQGLARARAATIAAALTAAGAVEPSRVSALDPAAVKRRKAGSVRIASEMTMEASEH
jgi:outer membrane protein OmpA-like peptidoglycan-associated protein